MNFLTGKIIQAICWTLLHSLWQGLLLAVVTGIVMVLSKRSSSSARYNLLSVLFVLFIVTTAFTFKREMHLATAVDHSQITSPNITIATNNDNSYPGITNNAAPQQNFTAKFIKYFNTHASLIVTIWFIIFMARCVKILSGLVYIQRIRHYKTNPAPDFWTDKIRGLANRLQIKRKILLLESAIVKVPVVVGFLKPAILIPVGLLTNLSTQEVESILIHELAHIRRKDYFFNLLQCFIDIVFFFNPAVLWISSLIRNERENCCDDIAIHETKNKRQFIQALVSFHQYNTAVSKYAMPFAAKQNRLVNRVKRIVNNNNHTLNPAEKIVLVVCFIVFSIALITVTNGQTSTPKKPADKSSTSSQSTSSSTNKQTGTNDAKASGKNVQPKTKNDVSDEADDNSGVASYYSQLQALGYKNISADELIELRNHGVTIDYIKSLNNAGYKDLSLDRLMELRDHGVSTDFITRLNEMGYKNISAGKAVELTDHGVNAGFINEFNKIGYSNITLDQAIALNDHGVNADFILGWRKAGINNITLEKAIQMKDEGVSVNYINTLHDAGFANVSLEQAGEMRNHGVDVEYINSLKEMGYNDITITKAIELRDHDVTVEFIKSLNELGYNNISLDKAQKLRDHGVNAEFIASFKQLGFNDISLDKAQELKDHGVNAAFIESWKKKTGSTFTLDEYILLKDRF